MLKEVRKNIFVGDFEVTAEQLKKAGITVVLIAADATDKEKMPVVDIDVIVFEISLHRETVNRPHVKDIACHIPKYMSQSGEKTAVLSPRGLIRAPWIVARAVCELEQKTIYELLMELQELLGKKFEVGKAYL